MYYYALHSSYVANINNYIIDVVKTNIKFQVKQYLCNFCM